MSNQRQQHKAHQKLFAENSLRVAMSDSSVAGIRVTDREGRILFVNETFQKLVGYRTQELIGVMLPIRTGRTTSPQRFRTFLRTPRTVRCARSNSASAARTACFLTDSSNVSPLLNENRRVIGWIGELYDITEQKRARERMKAAHERFTRVVQSMNSAICVLGGDPDRPRLLFRNTPYEKFFGGSPDGAIRLVKLISESTR